MTDRFHLERVDIEEPADENRVSDMKVTQNKYRAFP